MLPFIDALGKKTVATCQAIGSFFIFLGHAFQAFCTHSFNWRRFFLAMNHIGVESLPIVALTGASTGMVFALQSYIGFQRVGGEQLIGAVVTLGMARELGPILTALMITGRAGSAIAAEIATMRITEQIDALQTLCINPYSYLVVPRLIAAMVVTPCLTLISVACGVAGGYVTCIHVLGLNSESYFLSIHYLVEFIDVECGLIKSVLFGLIIAAVGTYKGFMAKGGARGVGSATTQAVVTSSILIVLADYFLTKFIEQL